MNYCSHPTCKRKIPRSQKKWRTCRNHRYMLPHPIMQSIKNYTRMRKAGKPGWKKISQEVNEKIAKYWKDCELLFIIRMKKKMTELGITQHRLALYSGLPISSISRLNNNTLKPTDEVLYKLAPVLGVNPVWLRGDGPPKMAGCKCITCPWIHNHCWICFAKIGRRFIICNECLKNSKLTLAEFANLPAFNSVKFIHRDIRPRLVIPRMK